MYALYTGQLTNEPKIYSLKYLTPSVRLFYYSITEWTQNTHNKIANTECLLELLYNSCLNPECTQ